MKRIVFALMLASVTSYCCAEWLKMAEVKEGEAVARTFIDSTSIRINGNLRRAMVLSNLEVSNNKAFPTVVAFQEFDCWENRSRVLSTTIYEGQMGQGKVIELPTEAAEKLNKSIGVWENIPVGHGDEPALKYVCAR